VDWLFQCHFPYKVGAGRQNNRKMTGGSPRLLRFPFLCKDESRGNFITRPPETGLFGKLDCSLYNSASSDSQINSLIFKNFSMSDSILNFSLVYWGQCKAQSQTMVPAMFI
jgi:hypothetical protein